MAPQGQTFVFIDEDQQKKYSKSTLSAINAQVAKYSHKHRKKPSKSQSAPSSPPSIGGAEPDKFDGQTTTQDDQLNNRRRRSSQPKTSVADVRHNGPDLQSITRRREEVSYRQRRKSTTPPQPIREILVPETSSSNHENDERPPEDLADLFQNLCRITKYPSHQAFPFFLNLEERRLAHYWFTEVLKDDFGMKLQLEDTFQGQLTRYPLAFQVPLRWIIAKAADRLNEKTGSQSLTVVYRSREKALNRLQDILKDTNTPTDEAIGSILQSIVHNPEFRKIHLRGMDAMIEARGGLEAVVKQSRITCAEHIFLQYTFAEFDITQLEELESLKSTFFEALLHIQGRANAYVQLTEQMNNWASSCDLLECTPTGGNLQKWSYTEQRKRVFSEQTALGQLIRQPFDMTSELMRKSRLFAALFQLNAMLAEYNTVDEKSLLLRRLEQAAETTASPDPVTGVLTMMAGAHIYMTGYVSRQVQEELGPYDYDRKGIPAAMKGIAAVKIFGLLLDSMRLRLVEYLQGWLKGESQSFLGPSNISAMSVVITQLWLQKIRSGLDAAESEDYFATAAS